MTESKNDVTRTDVVTGSGADVTTGQGSTVTTGQGSDVTTGQGSDVTTGQGSTVTTGQGSDVTTGQGSTVTTGQGAGVDTAALLELAVRAARTAGDELLRRYGKVEGLDTKSSGTDPVSDADRAAEQILVDLISAERPEDGILGEEGAATASRSGLLWVVDPLDGTVNYLYELDNFSVSVAVEDSDGALVGVVYDCTRNRMFSAIRGEGAFRDGVRLQVRAAVPLAQALLATGFGYGAERRAVQGALIAGVLPRVRDIRRIGSAALDLCSVAAGQVDIYFEEGIQRWDVAAGGLIAAEAGAVVTEHRPTGVPTGVLAAAPGLHDEAAAALQLP